MNDSCEICGKKVYPLCPDHLKMKNEEMVIMNYKTNKWVLIENAKCILCNNDCDKRNLFCQNCYEKVKFQKNSFNHKKNIKEIQSNYFKLREQIYNIENKETIKEYIITMKALSEELYDIHKDLYLKERVYDDILIIYTYLKSKLHDIEEKIETNNNFENKDFREKWQKKYQCEDGHYVRSLSEMLIDNWLFNHGYLHAYEKSVYMDTEPETIVLSDFYLPQGNVYIEFWGIDDDEKYLKRKEQKIKLYNDNEYNRIDLTEKDIKRMDDIMPRKLGEFIKKKK